MTPSWVSENNPGETGIQYFITFHSASAALCTPFVIFCRFLWFDIGQFSHIPKGHFSGTEAMMRLSYSNRTALKPCMKTDHNFEKIARAYCMEYSVVAVCSSVHKDATLNRLYYDIVNQISYFVATHYRLFVIAILRWVSSLSFYEVILVTMGKIAMYWISMKFQTSDFLVAWANCKSCVNVISLRPSNRSCFVNLEFIPAPN